MRVVVAAPLLLSWLLAAGATAHDYESFVSEKPPCRLAPLTEQQVMDAARKELGESFFSPPDMPYRRPSRIVERGCVYEVEYVILSVGDRWLSFDSIDGTSSILVARDLSIFTFSIIIDAGGG
jgi:hypothetical protein